MNISLRWLSRYVDLSDITPEQVLDDLTMSTAEVEGIEVFAGGLDDVVIGHVVEHGRHPDADKLSLNKVDIGGDELLSIICGAPNVGADQKVAVVAPGAVLPGGFKIKKAKIRGVESFGMICSERELGLSEEHDGILVLDEALQPGARFTSVVDVVDHVLEIDNKSINHRPDLWGHYGIARELAAIYDRPLEPLRAAAALPAAGRFLDIVIENPADCPRFTGVVIEGAVAGRSPDWLRYLLHAVGQRSIDLLVDLTNFVMFELGQPMHAFDMSFLDPSGIVVRRARDGEKIVTIDEVERALSDQDLVVTSGDQPVALAGVMGGMGSAVTAKTETLFLESANFHPSLIRRTSSRVGLRTDASARFEKSLDPANAETGSRRFIQLLSELCPGARAAGPMVDPANWTYAPKTVELRKARIDLKLGVEIEPARIKSILESLEFELADAAVGWHVTVPSFRATKDIAIEDDLIEEVGRMFRYDNIPEQPLRSVVAVPPRAPAMYLARELLRIGATEIGCHENYSYSFVDDAVLAAAHASDHAYTRARHPVAPESARIRRHVMPSLLGCVADNLRRDGQRRLSELRMMEHGKGYHPQHRDEHDLPREVHELALVWSRRDGEHPYTELRSYVDSMLLRTGRAVDMDRLAVTEGLPWLHPAKTVAITRDGAAVGYVGSLHPAVCRDFELPMTTAIANLDLPALLASGVDDRSFQSVPRFPSQPVDVALLVPSAAHVSEIAAFLRQVGKKMVRAVELFEVYRGEGLPEGKKSLNFTVTLGAADRTLDAKDEEKFLGRVRQRASEVGAELRG